MRGLVVQPPAYADVRALLKKSRQDFGRAALRRYSALIQRAYAQLRADPTRAGVVTRDELPDGVRFFHLRHARSRGVSPRQPRHFLVFTFDDATLTILRVLHDSMDIAGHLGGEE